MAMGRVRVQHGSLFVDVLYQLEQARHERRTARLEAYLHSPYMSRTAPNLDGIDASSHLLTEETNNGGEEIGRLEYVRC